MKLSNWSLAEKVQERRNSTFRHPREGGDLSETHHFPSEIPASAGMTVFLDEYLLCFFG